jgi:hypothetical protein
MRSRQIDLPSKVHAEAHVVALEFLTEKIDDPLRIDCHEDAALYCWSPGHHQFRRSESGGRPGAGRRYEIGVSPTDAFGGRHLVRLDQNRGSTSDRSLDHDPPLSSRMLSMGHCIEEETVRLLNLLNFETIGLTKTCALCF